MSTVRYTSVDLCEVALQPLAMAVLSLIEFSLGSTCEFVDHSPEIFDNSLVLRRVYDSDILLLGPGELLLRVVLV